MAFTVIQNWMFGLLMFGGEILVRNREFPNGPISGMEISSFPGLKTPHKLAHGSDLKTTAHLEIVFL